MKAQTDTLLVIRGGAIGDFILTFPVLAAIRNHLPGTRLEIMASPAVAPLAIHGGLADAWRSLDARELAGFFVHQGIRSPEFVRYFGGFDVILSYLHDPDGVFEGNIRGASRACYLKGPPRPDEASARHAAEALLEPLRHLGIEAANARPSFRLPASDRKADGRGFRLAIHPGSGSESKNWPLNHWRMLLKALVDSGDGEFLLVGGEAEADKFETLARELPAARRTLGFNLPLVTLAREIEICNAFLGHDSGISHLAAALNLPCTLLWGPSTRQVWAPRGEHIEILDNESGLGELPVNSVLGALNRRHPQLRLRLPESI